MPCTVSQGIIYDSAMLYTLLTVARSSLEPRKGILHFTVEAPLEQKGCGFLVT